MNEEQEFFKCRSVAVDLQWLNLQPGMNILDVGCGTGAITQRIARQVWPGRVVGLDEVSAELENAEREAATEGLENLQFVLGDACKPDLTVADFDVITTHTVLMHLSDPVAALTRQRELVRPGGLVAALSEGDWGTVAAYPISYGLERAISVLLSLIRLRGGDPEVGRKLPALFRAAGFKDVEISEANAGPTIISGAQLARGPWLAPLVGFLSRASSAGLISNDEISKISLEILRWTEKPDALLFWPRTVRAKAHALP
jgi:ubiquinone/menaquinone biosynthesis C-methylase UbiE